MLASAPKTESHRPSVLIVGAGINGAGLFRDLCLQGVDCLLIDRGDICEGASAAPSRLIHGGLKYLETGEFRLVRESAIERNRLLRNAPHYVKPLETLLPLRSWFGGSLSSALRFLGVKAKLTDRGALITEIGLRIYDLYNRKVQALPDHRFLGPRKLRQEAPDFDKTILAAGVYYEGRISHAERLGLELVLDGLAANPASAVSSYTRAAGQTKPGTLILEDALTGEPTTVSPKVIVNAGGAWIDQVNAALGIQSRHMGGSKGSHIIVDNPRLVEALAGRMVYFGTADGRVNLVYPFFGHALVGSTDIPVRDPDEAHCSEEEIGYLIKVVAEIFPTIPLAREQILLTYCGVRPLPRSEGVDIGAVSRDHSIARDRLPGTDIPVLSLIGGKWTTFRAFAEQAADDILPLVGGSRRLSTQDLAIGGGRDFPHDAEAQADFVRTLGARTGFAPERVQIWLDRYGERAAELARDGVAARDKPLVSISAYTAHEIAFICRFEHVRRLADLLLRRTDIAMSGLTSLAVVNEIADIAAEALGWDPQRKAAEISHALSELRRRAVPFLTAMPA